MPAFHVAIRLARKADAAAIAAMSRDFVETGLGWRYSAARICRLIDDRDHVCLAACDPTGELQGFAVMQFGDTHGHLVLLCVQPRHRRRGIGRALIDWLQASARVAGLDSLHLELRADNAGARDFYRRLGFNDTVLVPGYYAQAVAAQRMVLALRTAPSA